MSQQPQDEKFQALADRVFDVKEKLSDQEYKSLMEAIGKLKTEKQSLYRLKVATPALELRDGGGSALNIKIIYVVIDVSKPISPYLKEAVTRSAPFIPFFFSGHMLTHCAVSTFSEYCEHQVSFGDDEEVTETRSMEIQSVYILEADKL